MTILLSYCWRLFGHLAATKMLSFGKTDPILLFGQLGTQKILGEINCFKISPIFVLTRERERERKLLKNVLKHRSIFHPRHKQYGATSRAGSV